MKTKGLQSLLQLIFPAVFNIAFFVAGGTNHLTSVWISYGFIHLAYILLLLTSKFIRKGKSSAVFGFSLYALSWTYFIAELAVGIVFIIIAPEEYTAALLVQLCIAAVYGILLISNMIANEHTADAQEQRQHQVEFIKNASSEMKSIMDGITEKDLKKRAERVYDSLCTSPVKSNPSLAQMEQQLLLSISELSYAVNKADDEKIISITDSLLRTINERNRQLRILN